MKCERCGATLHKETGQCPRCDAEKPGFLARLFGENDSAEDAKDLPELVKLHRLAEVPRDRDWMLLELQRLSDFFAAEMEKYELYAELYNDLHERKEPSLWRWIAIGGAIMVLFYIALGSLLPLSFWAFFFVFWGIITTIGYVREGKKNEREKARLRRKLRYAENILRRIYNSAKDCFLPIGYTAPTALLSVLSDLESRKTESLQEALLWNQDKVGKFS